MKKKVFPVETDSTVSPGMTPGLFLWVHGKEDD
jgi:hypothetical protein